MKKPTGKSGGDFTHKCQEVYNQILAKSKAISYGESSSDSEDVEVGGGGGYQSSKTSMTHCNFPCKTTKNDDDDDDDDEFDDYANEENGDDLFAEEAEGMIVEDA